jgi:RNA polymerase sigma-70 factor (ECF subfamily)
LVDEAALLDRIRQYDQAALAQVYDDYYDRIYHYVYRFVGQVAAAEDLTHNLVVDSFRRGSAAQEVELTEWLEGYEPDLTHIVEQKLQLERVRRAVLDLTPAQQQVMALKFLEGLESVEVATILDKSEGAIDALQHRALLALRQALRPPPGAGPGSPSREREPAQEDIPPNVASSGSPSLAAALLASLVPRAHVSARPARSAHLALPCSPALVRRALCLLCATASRVVCGTAACYLPKVSPSVRRWLAAIPEVAP